jgi:hypothetical protein
MQVLNRSAIGGIAMLASTLWSLNASATLVFNDAFGGAASRITVGSFLRNGIREQWIAMQRISDNQCHWYRIGTGSQWPDYIQINAFGGNDTVTILPPGTDTLPYCGVPLSGPNPGPFLAWINGGDGNDRIYGGNYAYYIYGGLGDDHITSFFASAYLFGESGNDVIHWGGIGGAGWIDAGVGHDCIDVSPNLTPDGELCGNGTDRWIGGGLKPSDCEFYEPAESRCD